MNWLLSCLLCIPDLMFINFKETKKYVYCYWVASDLVKVFCLLDVIFFFVVPMSIIIILYVLIALKLKETYRKMRTSPVYGKQDRVKAVKMLAAVAGLFFVCWAPYTIYRSLMIIPKFNSDEYYHVWRAVYYLCSVNIYFSTAGNPILYSLMSRKFRRTFKEFLNVRPESLSNSRVDTSLLSTSALTPSVYGFLTKDAHKS